MFLTILALLQAATPENASFTGEALKYIGDLGPTGVMVAVAIWFTKYLKSQQDREDKKTAEQQTREDKKTDAFLGELKAQREEATKQFDLLRTHFEAKYDSIIEAINGKRG